MNDGWNQLAGQIVLAAIVGALLLGVIVGGLVGRRMPAGRGWLGLLLGLTISFGLLGWGYNLIRVDPAEQERWKPPQMEVVLPKGYRGAAWLFFGGTHPRAPQKDGVFRLEVPSEGVVAYADPGAAIEHADIKLVDPEGHSMQLQLLDSGNYVSDTGHVRFVGIFVGTTYELQQFSRANEDHKLWEEAYAKLTAPERQ